MKQKPLKILKEGNGYGVYNLIGSVKYGEFDLLAEAKAFVRDYKEEQEATIENEEFELKFTEEFFEAMRAYNDIVDQKRLREYEDKLERGGDDY